MKGNYDVKKKILFFMDTLQSGGKERQLVELLKQLSKRQDFKLELLLMSEVIHYQEVFELNIKINYLTRKIKFDPFFLYKLFKMVKRIHPDILHTWSTITALYAGPVAKLLNIKNVCGSIRGATDIKKHIKPWIINKLGFRFADRIVANSHAGLLSRNLNNNKKATCIQNGFDFARLKDLENPENVKKRFGISTDKIVGMVSSLDNRKDNEIFIRAAKHILTRRSDVTFLIVGEGPKHAYFQSLIEERQKAFIILTGRQDNIESIVNIFNIGVLTSKNEFFREGISNSIMEYMALAKPVIASDSGGNSEIIEDKVNGFLVKPKELDGLVEMITNLLDNPKIAREMGRAGKFRIEKKFNIEKMINNYIDLYKNFI
jgi:glycosyltransferase involved in cell wall biosynthesis